MFARRSCPWWVIAFVVFVALGLGGSLGARQDDPVVATIIQLGKTDNQVMAWNDYASNRFGGRETGSNAYRDATEWAVWQFRQWGLEAELDEVGELPVGFNRGPWFGRMRAPVEKALRFGTPSFTAGTKGIQRGGVAILKADPFSIPGRATGGVPVSQEIVEKKRAAVEAALAEVAANEAAFAGKWVLIPGASTGFARDGRRGTKLPDGSPEYLDAEMIPPVTRALVEAGALGTIQSSRPPAAAQDGFLPPLSILDGFVASWDRLPVLPDIKLLDAQYDEIKGLVEKGTPVELEFDVRNHFKMGPIKYHNVVATLRGATHPDEYVVIGGHFDAFSVATGGVDDGSGFSPNMEAMRLLAKAGARPKRTIVAVLFAAEESGLLGSQAWLRNRPGIESKVALMINRDGSPSAITGASVPPAWFPAFEKIVAPLATANPKWPFKLAKNEYPSPMPTTPGGSDHSSFQMKGVPTLSVQTSSARPAVNGEKERNFVYPYVWHTTNDLYDQLVPYTEHQQHSALATAVLAYGVANLDKPLSREGVYLPDGLYADITIGGADAPKRVIASLDFANAPLHAAAFVRLFEGNRPGSAAQGRPPAAAMAMMGQGRPPEIAPVGRILDVRGTVAGVVTTELGKSMAVRNLPKRANRALRQDRPGILSLAGPSTFSFTTAKKGGGGVAIGTVVAGLGVLPQIGKDDPIRAVRILRVGKAAREFATDDEGFKALMNGAK